jgi:putative redox protein
VIKLKITLRYNNNLHFIANIRQFENIELDEPDTFHGTNLGPSSVEYLLVSIGGCVGTTFVYCLQKNNIKIDNLNIIIEGILSHKGPKKKLRITEVNVTIEYKIKEKSLLRKIEFCKQEFQQNCTVTNSIIEGFPININYKT